MSPPVELLVFDLDGTLIDSRRDLAESANAVLVESGGQPLREEAIARMVGDGAAVLVRRVFDAAGVAPPADALERFLGVYNNRLLRFTRPYAGIQELLSAVSDRKLAVLTNKPLGATRSILDGLELARYFPPDLVVGGDGKHARKPDPAALVDLSERTGTPTANTLMVGDSIIDWTTARRAGAQACVAAYGFGFADFPVGELSAGDRVIRTPSELLSSL